jgi:hypothetical protein
MSRPKNTPLLIALAAAVALAGAAAGWTWLDWSRDLAAQDGA